MCLWEKIAPPPKPNKIQKNMGEKSSGYTFYEGFWLRNIQEHQIKGSIGRCDLGTSDTCKAGKGCVSMYMYIHLPCTRHQSSFHYCFWHQMWLKMIIWSLLADSLATVMCSLVHHQTSNWHCYIYITCRYS